MSNLHQPVRIGAWELPNRIVMVPPTRCRASVGRVPNALMAEYYLPHQFLNDGINRRGDSYGGSIENRARFLLEAVDAAISVWGADRVGLHLSPTRDDDSDPAATYGHVARECGARGLAFLFVRESLQANPRFSQGLREAFTGAFIANQELTREQGEQLLSNNEADAVSYGRLFIANPDLVERLATDAPLNEPDPSSFYGGTEKGYTDYPTLAEVAQLT